MYNISSEKSFVAIVTGATGFVGSHLVRQLVRDGWEVHILIRENSLIPEFDEFFETTRHIYDGTTDGIVRCVAAAQPLVLFHVASLMISPHASKDVVALNASNVLFGNQLLEAMRVNEVRYIINTGTFWQHYNNNLYDPVDLYAASKQAFEAIMKYYVQACGIRAITLTLFDTYGPSDSRPKLFNLLKNAVDTGISLDMSKGEQLIDLVHIDDVVRAYQIASRRLLENKVIFHENYVVSSCKPLPLKEIVKLYAKVIMRDIPVNWDRRPYRFREIMVPWNRGALIPGWSPVINLHDGLASINNKKG